MRAAPSKSLHLLNQNFFFRLYGNFSVHSTGLFCAKRDNVQDVVLKNTMLNVLFLGA